MLKKITAIALTALLTFGFSLTAFAAVMAEDTHLTVYAGGQATTTFITSEPPMPVAAPGGYGPGGRRTSTPAPGVDYTWTANGEKTIYTDKGTGQITDDSVTYTARLDSNLTGSSVTDTIGYDLSDGGTITTADFIVNILKSNITANNQTQNVAPGATITGQLTASGVLNYGGSLYFLILDDIDIEEMGLTATSPRGVLTIDSDGKFSYTAHATSTEDDMFYFVAGDSAGGASFASITFKIATPPSPTAPSWGYVDIKGSWVEPYADKEAYDNTFIGPKVASDYYFQPIASMTRGDFIIQMNAALGINSGDYADKANPFEEKNLPTYLENQAKAAYYNKVIDGVLSNGKIYLMANNYLTRSEAVKMIANVAKERGATDISDVTLIFHDTYEIPSWVADSVKLMKKAGVIQGYDDNTFRPFRYLDRAEATKILSIGKTYISTLPTLAPTVTPSPAPTASVSPAPVVTASPAPVTTP